MYLSLEVERPGLRGSLMISGLEGAKVCGYGDCFGDIRCADFLFMDDNARPHRANIVDKCLQSEDITRLDWPSYTPDLNLIEHVWDMLGRRIVAHQSPSTCLLELRRALLDE
ncbi:DDE_3 domain-containing protein [Trichonephila clavipes]|nr:DDE_3 domain-containing protein [Trichonephila clavipes]